MLSLLPWMQCDLKPVSRHFQHPTYCSVLPLAIWGPLCFHIIVFFWFSLVGQALKEFAIVRGEKEKDRVGRGESRGSRSMLLQEFQGIET